MKPLKRHQPLPASAKGFALIATLSLMILLAILAVGLLSLSSVALRSSSRGEAQAEARANARMALMMAIGQLQREMGPDSRISAPHDAGSASTGGQPHWTAVYDAWKRPEDPGVAESPADRDPNFRGWLVSGTDPADGIPAGTGEEVTLVGEGSLGASATATDRISVPMIAAKAEGTDGRMAWWTADESRKAKLNAGPAGEVDATPLADSQSPPYLGHRAFPELAGHEWQPGERSLAISHGALNLAAGLGIAGTGSLNHGITLHSAGVLADVRLGRLRWDLTNALSRPVAELENKPLYTADGRMNRFTLSSDGSLSSSSGIGTDAGGANRWGINLEELHLFHEVHREVDWSTGAPRLVNRDSPQEIARDRFFIYKRPVTDAVSVMLSFVAEPDNAPDRYKLAGMIDLMVAITNPNDIPVVWPSSVVYRVKVEGFPYRPRWNIRRGANRVHGHTVQAINRPFLQSSIREGFTLEPGEAAVFGATETDTQSRSINLTRGYRPRGGVRINEDEWSTDGVYQSASDGLRAGGLLEGDVVDFTMTPAANSNGGTPSGWISCLSEMRTSASGSDIRIGTLRLQGGAGSVLTSAPINGYFIPNIRPIQQLNVRDFIGTPLPVLMVTTMSNVEKSRTQLQPPNAFASRPYHFIEPAVSNRIVMTTSAENTNRTLQEAQLVSIGETMDYEFGNDRTLAAGAGGRNLYHGGAREVGLGGTFNVIKRRIPLAPPLSLGAFENAIACGFVARFGGTALSGLPAFPSRGAPDRLPAMAKNIGNSWASPFLTADSVFSGSHHDPSWMVNTALWDGWFLSGLAQAGPSGAWDTDARSPRKQFEDLVDGTAPMRNKRLVFHPHKSVTEALDELFDGDVLAPDAIDKVAGYLLVDGAFNVNSTSAEAWEAFLTSVRNQQILDSAGAAQPRQHPFGTLGHAYSSATAGVDGDWNGFRDLSDTEIKALATAIVTEVKARGPFLSMADFVNRRPDSSEADQRAVGALQAAIDKTGLNDRFSGNSRNLAATDIPVLAGSATIGDEPNAARAPCAAGYLSQAALLTAFGSQIAVRGDTFLIRAYGDSRGPGDSIRAKAWCEAVVQRTPEYVDQTDAPEKADSLTPANAAFGRQFRIVSFRWLNPDEV